MVKYILLSLLLMTFGVNAQSYTKVKNLVLCKKLINDNATQTHSILGDFTEEIHSSMFNSVKKSKGLMRFREKSKIRWEHTSPKKQIILINEKEVRMTENGKEITNATSNRIMKKIQGLMLQLFSGEFLNEKEFSIDYLENTENYKLILAPKNSRMSKYISSIEMIVNKKTVILKQLTLKESEEDKIVYKFSNIEINKYIPISVFKLF